MKKKVLIIGGSVLAFLTVCVAALFIFILPKADKQPPKKEMTLMIYMIGSDLEAKGSAATKDLEEMVGSGVDLEKANVLVYTGGSPKWHNDVVTTEEKHSLLELGAGGFNNVKTFEQKSMGKADNLSAFLEYAYTNYPANNFSLVLWNHGSGPLIGYGADMLYNNDSLTLMEMQEALENSPFSKDNKLSFVGFDACLMSSAELCCVWADYAEYLIASQEIEPAFGWDYAFLKNLGKSDTVTLSKSILDIYFDTCEKYYERKGYDDRDTTLSCMDLSKAGELKNAINGLFKTTINDVDFSYNQLMYNRVHTRALGRATTGSEYDLVDLDDMATQLESRYPDEAKAIKDIISKMVVYNVTNAEKLCGVSLYYPFYNKGYYEKSWGSVYQELNVFSEYTAYINKFTNYWLKQDLSDVNLDSIQPSIVSDNEYKLTLTDEQEKSYANANYYILEKKGEQLYKKIYSSSNIEKDGNELIANFDGNIVYATDGYKYMLPVITEHDTVGDITRYSVYAMTSDEQQGENVEFDNFRFHIAVNNKSKVINTSALLPYEADVDNSTLVGGKIEEPDLSEYDKYEFPQERYRFLTKDDNGNILPVDQWRATGILTRYESYICDGMDFIFAPLEEGEYVLIFEVEDTKGNKYCSDVLPITADGKLEPLYERETINISWNAGDKIKLLEKNNVDVYLTAVEHDYYGKIYTLSAENKNDFDVEIELSELGYNDNHYVDGYTYFIAKANSTTVGEHRIDFCDDAELGIIDKLESMFFNITVTEIKITGKDSFDSDIYKHKKRLIYKQPFYVTLSDKTSFVPQSIWSVTDSDDFKVTRGIKAENQVVYDKNGVKISLVKLGGDGETINAHFRFENKTDEYKYLVVDNLIFDSIPIKCAVEGIEVTLPPGCVSDKLISIFPSDFDKYAECDMSSIKNVSVRMRFTDGFNLDGAGGREAPMIFKIKLSKQGKGCKFTEGDTVIYEENGVRIAMHKNEGATDSFMASVVNTSGKDLYIDMTNISIGSKKYDSNDAFLMIYCYPQQIGNNEKSYIEFDVPSVYGDAKDLKFDLVFYNYNYEYELWSSSKQVSLFKEY